MFTKQKRRRSFKKKLLTFILVVGIFGVLVFFLNTILILRSSSYISPIGGSAINKTTVEKTLKENNVPFISIASMGNFFLINIKDNGQIKLSGNKDIYKQVTSLQRILRELTIEGKQFKSIDFRFSEPIITF
jgi:hypothetical protein